MRLPFSTLAGLALLAAAVIGSAAADARGEGPAVAASIAPVHSIVARVMVGAGTPALLIPPGASPHHHALRPSEARALARAAAVFWVGPSLETQLPRALETIAAGARKVALGELPGLVRLPPRWGGGAEPDHAGAAGGRPAHADAHGHGAAVDPHLWLDPANARRWAEAIARTLQDIDPGRAALYRANAAAAAEEYRALEVELRTRLAPLAGRPFVVLHDAYQYFEHRFGLAALAAVVPADDIPPGPARVARIRTLMREAEVGCLMRPPGEGAALAAAIAEASGARVVVADPVGADLPPGPGLYPDLMRGLAAAFVECLGGAPR